MKKFLFYMIAVNITLCLVSCENKEKKAFEEAYSSLEISKMKAFVSNYPNADVELLDSAKIIISEWEADSADFAYICQEKDVVKRFEAEEKYIQMHEGGINMNKVYELYEKDEEEAEAIKAKEEAIKKKVQMYTKWLKNNVFYTNPQNGLILLAPDAEGKGQGAIIEIDYFPTIYDFHYTINLENMDDDDVVCKMDKYDRSFTATLYEKKITVKSKGYVDIYLGETDEKLYKSVEERVAKINKGEEVYGNPKTRVTIY